MGSLSNFSLLLITDGFDDETPSRVEAACAALPKGAAAVMLRAKRLDGRALLQAAERLRPVAPILLVNDRADVALAAGADGVHLPARGLPPKTVRRFAPAGFIVGCSTHSLIEARMAARGGADYVCFGPVFATGDKGPPVGVSALAEVAAALSIPVFALGGVDAARAPECVRAGARAACIGAVLGRPAAAVADGARALLGSVQAS